MTFTMPIVLDKETMLLSYARPYGVKGINYGGCVSGQAKGFKGAMRRSAHAHCMPRYPDWYGWICIKSSHVEKILTTDGKPNHLFWHEVGHIYRRSWTEGECDRWAWNMVRTVKK